jgi:membrane-bound inhibitor of C-type lysozyme
MIALRYLLTSPEIPMKALTDYFANKSSKGYASVAASVSIVSIVSALGCSSHPIQPSTPNLPPPRQVVIAPTAPVQQNIPPSTPQTQVIAPAPVQSTPIATSTTPAPTMSIDTGLYRCELGVRVTVKKIAPDKSSMVVNWKNKDYTLAAVSSQSGALRFEDKANGLVWMAIVGKSQLLNSKLGQRLANDCNL